MINAKKSILSLWKGMNGPLSAILKKRRKESGKNCQNTAAKRKSISFVQPAVTVGKYAEIVWMNYIFNEQLELDLET